MIDRKLLHKLGDYMLAHREAIIGEWVRAVEHNPDLTSPEHLDYTQLVDHLPQLCQEMAELLKSSHPEEDRSEISRTARGHGKHRWQQGYSLGEVIREASVVRRILFRNWMDAFAREAPEFHGETRQAAESVIHQAIDDVVIDSAQQFVIEQQKSIRELNTMLGDALAELREQKAEAEAANKAKDKFLAMLGHELRTPLNPILLWATGTLAEGQIAPPLREGLEMVRRNLELEASLIDDLLDVARITRGKLHLDLQLSDAASLFRDALEMVQAELLRKRIETRIKLSAQNHRVMVDRRRLKQVFWNLLTNAQKFTSEGGTVWIRSFNEGHDKLVFEIRDNGKGIEPDLLPKIFEAFEQGAGPPGGLGLGLAISKAIIESHGGKIQASSEGSGSGATFKIEFETAQE